MVLPELCDEVEVDPKNPDVSRIPQPTGKRGNMWASELASAPCTIALRLTPPPDPRADFAEYRTGERG